jgi:putative FmdB family regulatory protein
VPTYQYTCTECGEPLEAVQKFTDAPLAVCPACGGRLRKVFSAVGIVFKGSGFYRTDSRNGASATAPADKDKAKDKDREKSSSESSSTSDSSSSNGSGDKAAAKKAEPAKSSSASEKVA